MQGPALNRCRGGRLASILLVGMAILCCTILPLSAASTNEAVVKVFTVYNSPDYYNPWQMEGPQAASGSGCIIEGQRILTSAHVVADQIFIQVKRAGQAMRYTATVAAIAHEADLAILEVSDPSFFAGVEPIPIGDLPRLRDRVVVYGFPTGGDELAITEGVVSRVEHQYYTHSREYLLTCQIDAAINPGNSGGPVIRDGEIAGVAFQAGRGENIGYMVPAPIIKRFLKDVEDGRYDGIPGIGIMWQAMENHDLRTMYGMSSEQTGVLITKTLVGSPAVGALLPQDVLLAIDGTSIANDGTIEFRTGERTSFSYHIQSRFAGDTLELHILRDGAPMVAAITLTGGLSNFRLVPNEQYDTLPRYYILGGLVFEPLSLNLLKIWGADWYGDAPRYLVDYYFRGEPSEERREVVVLMRILADEINEGYQNYLFEAVEVVNGRRIADLADLIAAFESNEEAYHVIVTEGEGRIVLNRAKVDAKQQEILDKYRIPSQ